MIVIRAAASRAVPSIDHVTKKQTHAREHVVVRSDAACSNTTAIRLDAFACMHGLHSGHLRRRGICGCRRAAIGLNNGRI